MYGSREKKCGWVSVRRRPCRFQARLQVSSLSFQVLSLPPTVPRLLFDGWSYQDYMAVLSSEDEIEELAGELVDVAKVTERRTSMPQRSQGCKRFTLLELLQSGEKNLGTQLNSPSFVTTTAIWD